MGEQNGYLNMFPFSFFMQYISLRLVCKQNAIPCFLQLLCNRIHILPLCDPFSCIP